MSMFALVRVCHNEGESTIEFQKEVKTRHRLILSDSVKVLERSLAVIETRVGSADLSVMWFQLGTYYTPNLSETISAFKRAGWTESNQSGK